MIRSLQPITCVYISSTDTRADDVVVDGVNDEDPSICVHVWAIISSSN